MPLKADCSFCGKPIEPGTGLMFVRNDNQRFYFCSRKCERNLLHLGRRSRRIKWTKAYERGPSPPQPQKPVEEVTLDEEPKKRLRGRRKPRKPVEEEPLGEEPAGERQEAEGQEESEAIEEGKTDEEEG